ncbi:MAG: class I SAM-dependent methyltransferase [Pseudomonadales bacterium]
MTKIETAHLAADTDLTPSIKSFWTENVNAERIMGREVTSDERGSAQYFQDLTEQRYRSHRHLLPWIKSMQSGRRVLEVGCGVGLDSFTMAQHGLQVTAVDLTDIAVETVKERFKDHGLDGEFRAADACALPFEDNQFDYVYSFGVLHHTADTEKSIDEVHRVLKPGGEAKIMLYNLHSLNEVVHRLLQVPFEEKDKVCPVVRRFTKAEVKSIFQKYSNVDIDLDFVFGEGYGNLFKLTPLWLYRLLSKTIGWHLMISAKK